MLHWTNDAMNVAQFDDLAEGNRIIEEGTRHQIQRIAVHIKNYKLKLAPDWQNNIEVNPLWKGIDWCLAYREIVGFHE